MNTNIISFLSTGCVWNVEYSGIKNLTLEKKILNCSLRFNLRYSRFKNNSFTASLQKHGKYKINNTDYYILKIYKQFYKFTNGSFSPLIGTNLSLAGYNKYYTLKPKKLITLPNINSVYSFNRNYIIIKKGGYIFDFGGVGKGLLIDLIYSILKKHNISTFIIESSGDIKYYDKHKTAIKIGLSDPKDNSKIIGYTNLQSGYSICGSAHDKRNWGKYSHILDGVSNVSPKKITGTFVISKKALVADGIATCLFMSKSSSFKNYSFDYLILMNEKVIKSKKFILNTL